MPAILLEFTDFLCGAMTGAVVAILMLCAIAVVVGGSRGGRPPGGDA